VFSALAAVRTTIRRLLYLFLLVKKITFVHNFCSDSFRILSFAQLAQIAKTINPGLVAVAPAKVEGVAPDDADIADLNSLRNAVSLQHSLACPFVNALRTRAGAPEIGGSIATAAV